MGSLNSWKYLHPHERCTVETTNTRLAGSLLQKKRTDLPARIILARAELAMGNYGEALAELKKVFLSDPHNIAAFQKLDQFGCTASEQRSVETGE